MAAALGEHNENMVGIEDLRRIVGEIEHRLQRVVGEDSLQTRLTRDLSRAQLYLQAMRTGYADLVPERLSVDLIARYQSPKPAEAPEESATPETG